MSVNHAVPLATDLQSKLDHLIHVYLNASNLRPEILFRRFLPTGYQQTTLSSVPEELLDSVIISKVCLGMMITLYDDLADNRKFRDSHLLQYLYQLNVGADAPTPRDLLP